MGNLNLVLCGFCRRLFVRSSSLPLVTGWGCCLVTLVSSRGDYECPVNRYSRTIYVSVSRRQNWQAMVRRTWTLAWLLQVLRVRGDGRVLQLFGRVGVSVRWGCSNEVRGYPM